MTFQLRKIEVLPTSRCNLACPACVGRQANFGAPKDIPHDRLLQLAGKVRGLNIGHIVISGISGEPLLNSGIKPFMKRLKEGPSEKQYIGLHTNGTLLDEQTVELLTTANRPGDYVNIHLDAPRTNPDLYKLTHGVSPQLQKRTLAAIEHLGNKKAQKPEAKALLLRVNTMLSVWHKMSDLENLVLELIGIGVDKIRLSVPIVPIGAHSFKGFSVSSRQMGDFIEARTHLMTLSQGKTEIFENRLNNVLQVNNFPHCFVKESALVIGPDGTFSPCCATTFQAFPFKLAIRPEESFVELAAKMARMNFDPKIFCPACSRDDYNINLKEQQKAEGKSL